MDETANGPVVAAAMPARTRASTYPPAFGARMEGRVKQPLGDPFGLTAFGVNRTTLKPGAVSALHHSHSASDEFIYVLQGEAVLTLGEREYVLCAGMCAGFPAEGPAHHLHNRSDADAVYLEIGERAAGDTVTYPADDIAAHAGEGGWVFTRKDGTAFPE